jgi:hypothetical protein
MIRQHTGAIVVAAAMIIAAFPHGLFEPGAYAAAGIVIWALVIPGVIGQILPRYSVGQTAVAAGISLAAIAAIATLSTGWAHDQGRAFDEGVRAWAYLGLFILAAGTASGAGRREWVTGLTFGLTVVAGIALFAYLQPGTFDSGRPEVASAAGRLAYPIGYWNATASMLAAGIVLLSFWGARAATLGVRSLAVAAIPFSLLAVWLTHSRGGVAAVIVGWIALVVATTSRRRQLVAILVGAAGGLVLILIARPMHALTSGLLNDSRNSEGNWLTLLAVVVTIVTAVVAWRTDGWWPRVRVAPRTRIVIRWVVLGAVLIGVILWNPIHRFNEFRQPPAQGARAGVTQVSSHGRWQFWTVAVDAFEDHPLDGLGAGGFEEYWAQHGTIQRFITNPHSLPLQQGSELGLLGLIPLAGLIGAIAVAAWRRVAQARGRDAAVLLAVVVSAAVGAAVDWTWQFPVVIAPAIVCAALLTASAHPKLLTGGGRRLGLGLLLTGWLAIAACSLVAIGELELARSREAANAGHLDSAIDRARDARSVEPWSGEPNIQLALLEEQRHDYPLALAYLSAARDRDSADWRLAVIEARIRLKLGQGPAAHQALLEARRLSPILFSARHTGR